MTKEMFNEIAKDLESDEVLIFSKNVNTDHSTICAHGQLEDVILAATKALIGSSERTDRKPFALINAASIIVAHLRRSYAPDDEKDIIPGFSFEEQAGGDADEEAAQDDVKS